MATTTKELSVQLEEVTKRLRALESGQHVMTSSPGLPLEKWNDHGFVHRHEIKPLVRALNAGGGGSAELEERVETLESGYTGLSSSMRNANSAITDIYGAIRANTTYTSFGDIPSTSLGVFTVGGASASPIPDSPYPGYRGLWEVEQRGVPGYLYQEVVQVLSGFVGFGLTFTRVQNGDTWSDWYRNIDSVAVNAMFDINGSTYGPFNQGGSAYRYKFFTGFRKTAPGTKQYALFTLHKQAIASYSGVSHSTDYVILRWLPKYRPEDVMILPVSLGYRLPDEASSTIHPLPSISAGVKFTTIDEVQYLDYYINIPQFIFSMIPDTALYVIYNINYTGSVTESLE